MPGFATIESAAFVLILPHSGVLTYTCIISSDNILFYQARLFKNLWRGSFSLRNNKNILKCHLCAFVDKIPFFFQSELCHYR